MDIYVVEPKGWEQTFQAYDNVQFEAIQHELNIGKAVEVLLRMQTSDLLVYSKSQAEY